MKVSRSQAEENRNRVLDVASSLFRKHGFEGVGLKTIMARAGLTNGAFYGQFKSKTDLAALAFSHACDQTYEARQHQQSFHEVLAHYLSPSHRDGPEQGCPFAALGNDLGRQDPAVQRAATQGYRARLSEIECLLAGAGANPTPDRSIRIMSEICGALMLSRAVDDPELSDRILEISRLAIGDETGNAGTS